jgi:peptide-methionine (S)-S-oxide reductase
MKKLFLLLMGVLLMTAPAHADNKITTATSHFIVAGGCFWCVESNFDTVKGVVSTTSGYTGGTVKNPTYDQVSAGGTGHKESVDIAYDPAIVSYEDLLAVFWRSIDPLDAKGQFCDKGDQYQSAIFYATAAEKTLAEKTLKETEKTLGHKVETLILPAGEFYPAEEYHQDYHDKNPIRYKFYRQRCGRDARVQEIWGDKGFKHE